jgi:hypothetical protein
MDGESEFYSSQIVPVFSSSATGQSSVARELSAKLRAREREFTHCTPMVTSLLGRLR